MPTAKISPFCNYFNDFSHVFYRMPSVAVVERGVGRRIFLLCSHCFLLSVITPHGTLLAQGGPIMMDYDELHPLISWAFDQPLITELYAPYWNSMLTEGDGGTPTGEENGGTQEDGDIGDSTQAFATHEISAVAGRLSTTAICSRLCYRLRTMDKNTGGTFFEFLGGEENVIGNHKQNIRGGIVGGARCMESESSTLVKCGLAIAVCRGNVPPSNGEAGRRSTANHTDCFAVAFFGYERLDENQLKSVLNTYAGVGYFENHTTRTTTATPTTATAKFHCLSTFVGGEGIRNFIRIGNGQIGLRTAVSYDHIDQHKYAETSTNSFSFPGVKFDRLAISVGVNFDFEIQHGDDSNARTMLFAGCDVERTCFDSHSSYTVVLPRGTEKVPEENSPRNAIVITCGVSGRFSNSLQIACSASHRVGKGLRSTMGGIGLDYAF
jgi:hypothetical protein